MRNQEALGHHVAVIDELMRFSSRGDHPWDRRRVKCSPARIAFERDIWEGGGQVLLAFMSAPPVKPDGELQVFGVPVILRMRQMLAPHAMPAEDRPGVLARLGYDAELDQGDDDGPA